MKKVRPVTHSHIKKPPVPDVELRFSFKLFDHTDAALELLRQLEPGHGVDTRDGRSYAEVTADGLGDIARRLNNLAARGFLNA